VVPALRRAFNAQFSAERYRALVADLEAAAGFPIPFRICETPLFLPAALTRELMQATREIAGAVTSPAYLAAATRAVPPDFAVPGEDAHTTFLQIDFALARGEDGGVVVPRLIELQGFPSLYAFQWLLDRAYREHFEIAAGVATYFDGLDAASYVERLREAIVGDCDPENVVLLEIEPERQKTRVDFAVTERLLGVKEVCATAVVERGGRLFYTDRGREVPIHRVYNRVIFDELERRGLRLDPLFRRDLDVTWVGHPNWFWKISKFSLPFLSSPYCPPAAFVADLAALPDDLDRYVLKPLYSFAGLGVEMHVTAERLRALDRPEDYILQRKVEYAPVVDTPDGPAKAEVRMMLVRRPGEEAPVLINNLVRMSKGLMSGVDFNKDRSWIGASVAYHPPVEP
jgi:hypothetical protein